MKTLKAIGTLIWCMIIGSVAMILAPFFIKL